MPKLGSMGATENRSKAAALHAPDVARAFKTAIKAPPTTGGISMLPSIELMELSLRPSGKSKLPIAHPIMMNSSFLVKKRPML